MFNIRREHLMISNNVHSQNVVGQYLSFHIKNRHQAILFQIDKANDHNSVCLLRGGISREDLPADLSDIGYPVNWYSTIWHNVTLHLYWRAIWGHIWKFNFDINSNIAVLIISFSVPAHAEQARHLHSRGCGRISPLVRFCSSVWPAWQNQCSRHQPGNIIHIAKCKTDHIHIFICSFILWIPKTLLVMIVVPHILNVFFRKLRLGTPPYSEHWRLMASWSQLKLRTVIYVCTCLSQLFTHTLWLERVIFVMCLSKISMEQNIFPQWNDVNLIPIRHWGANGDFTTRRGSAGGRYWGEHAKASFNRNIFHIFCTFNRFWNIELTLNIRTSASPSCSQKFSMKLSQRIPWTRLTLPVFQPHAREDNFPVTNVRWFVGTSSCWADTKELDMRRTHLQRARHAATTVEVFGSLLHPAKITWPSVSSPRYVTFQRFGRSFHL